MTHLEAEKKILLQKEKRLMIQEIVKNSKIQNKKEFEKILLNEIDDIDIESFKEKFYQARNNELAIEVFKNLKGK